MNLVQVIKVFYLQFLAILLAFVAMVLVSYYYVSGIIEKEMVHNGEAFILASANRISASLSEAAVSINDVGFLVEDMVSEGKSQEEIENALERWIKWVEVNQERLKNFVSVYGIIRGELLDGHKVPAPADFDPKDRPWYIGALQKKGEVFFTEPYLDIATGRQIISASRTMFDRWGKYIGIISLDIDVSELIKYIHQLKMSDAGYGYLLNKQLKIVVHPLSEYVGVDASQVGDKIDNSVAAIIRKLPETGVISGEFVVRADGRPSVVFLTKMINDWYLGIASPVDTYYTSVNRMALVLSLIGFALMAGLSYLLMMAQRMQGLGPP